MEKNLIPEYIDYKGAHILIVDDDPASLKIFAGVLRHWDFSVGFAEKPSKALMIAAASHPDCIILDIIFGEGPDGFALLEALQRNDTLKYIPVIVYTALEPKQAAAKSYAMGAAAYLHKPMESGAILARVTAHVHRYRMIKKLIYSTITDENNDSM